MNSSDPVAGASASPLQSDDRSTRAHRQFIGYIGLFLPLALWLVAAWRPVRLSPSWEHLDSVSAYYYTGSVSLFAGALAALAAFLLTYKGYDNRYGRRDRVAAIIAGIAAILVALFPTAASNNLPAFPWWKGFMGAIHVGAAVVLFLSFGFFSLFQFPRTNTENSELPPDKKKRNFIYYFCGAAILLSILWAGIAALFGAAIFWPEVLALEFFAISWLVKGRAEQSAIAMGRQTLRYGLHPRMLAKDAWKAIRVGADY